MGLFIPTSGAQPPFTGIQLTKGQLYNLDNNEWLNFQFNPEIFDYRQEFNWGEIQWKGSEHGGDLQYTGSGPYTFDLQLLFVGEPHAPNTEYSQGDSPTIPFSGIAGTIKIDFEFIESMLNRWTEPLENKRRPSRIKVILGPRSFMGVITNLDFRITEFFPDLSAREARLTIGFRQWELTE